MRGLLRKEIKQILRDPSAILIAFLMPLVLLLVNGFGISLDASHMPRRRGHRGAGGSRARHAAGAGRLALSRRCSAPPACTTRRPRSTGGQVRGIAGGARGFRPAPGAIARTGRPPAHCASTPPTRTPRASWKATSAARCTSGCPASSRRSGCVAAGGIALQIRDWFNPELRSADAIVPGVIAMVMTMAGTLLTAAACRASGSVARWRACSPRRRIWAS